ncbi:hypothetical protein SUGI_0088800 [Cryptomeria japonica]|nr:hypothetical protein SUGI_0088800 [Cryptomeria japonica]
MNLGCNATPSLKVLTSQHQIDHMVKNSNQENLGGDDTVSNNSLDRFEKFSIRKYVFSVRAKDIKNNWPFSQKYVQTCLENGRRPLLPPFESRNDILQEKFKSKEHLVAGNDIKKSNMISDCSNKEKIEDSRDYENGMYREGWLKKQKNHPRKKKMVPRKARNGQTLRRNTKESIVEGLVNVDEVQEAKGDTIEEKTIPREYNDKCQETEKNLMVLPESDAMACVADTDLARSLELAIGEHGTRKITCESIYKQQKNEFESSDKHLNAKGRTEVRKKKRKKMVASELKTLEDSKKEQAPEKNKDGGEKNDVFGNSISLPDALVPKVCPVCRTFSSTSNTALNAHIDRCLYVEANARKAGTKSAKPKVRTIKKRSLADICAVAPVCTLEDLEQNTGEEDQLATDVNQLPLDGPIWREKTKWKRHRQKVQNAYVDSKGKKLRVLSNLKGTLEAEECQQKKFPKRRKKVASTTLVQCSEGAANVQDSVSSKKSKKKVHAASSAKHAQIEETVKEKPTSSSLGTSCKEKPFVSGNARIETKRKQQMCSKQVAQEQESYSKNDKGSTDVQETTRSPLEEELHKSPSKLAPPSISEGQSIQITVLGQTNNETWAAEMSESDRSPSVEASENSDCKRKRHTSRLHSHNDMVHSVSRNELASTSLTMEEGSRANAQSQCQAPTKPSELFEGVNNQPCEEITETQSHSNSFVGISCQDSRITYTSHGASVIVEPENRTSVVGHGTVDVSTETPAQITGVSFQDPSNKGKNDLALCEENEGKSSLIFHENSNPSKAMQETVAPQKFLGTNCVGINDAAKERDQSMSLQNQALKENAAAQNDISCLNSATDASAILSPSDRQFISFARDPVLSNLLNATTNICASSSSTYLYNGLTVEQSKSHSTRVTSISENVNSNNTWMAETERSNPRSMQERPQASAQKFTNTSCGVFGDAICPSSSTFSKGLPLTLQGNLFQKVPFPSKDSQYLNQQSSFGNMKLTSVTVPQVVSASTLAKQLGEGKTAEEILHGCFMIEQTLSACNSKSNQAGQNSVHNISTNPSEKQVGSKQNLNNSPFGISNGSYLGNQVVDVAPYAYSIQKRGSLNGRNFPSASLGSSGAAYSSGLVNNQGLDNINCFSEPSMFGNPTVRLMGKNLIVANTDGGQSKQPDTNPNSMEEFRNASYLRLLGFTSEENLLQDGNNQLGRSMESSINFDQDMFHTFEGVRSQESRLLWNRNGCNQKPTSAVGNFSEWLQNISVSTYQSSVEATLTSAGPVWCQSGLTNSNMKFSSPHVSTASVENRTSNRSAGVISQAKRQSSSAVHSQSDHAVIVIDDSPDVDAVPNLSGLEPTSFSGRPNKFEEGNSVGGISNYDSIFRSGKAWPQVSSIPSLYSSCKESTVARSSNLQRAKEVQAELRRLGITNPGNYGQPSFAVHPQSEPEVIIIDDTPDEEAVSNLPLLEPTSFNTQPRQFQEANYNSMFRSGNTWAPSIPTHFSACKESTLSCGLNHQRAKEVQAELRRLGITNPGIAQSSSSFLKPMRGGWANDLNNVL